MTTPNDQTAADLFKAAVQEHVRGMNPDEFGQLVAATRPPGEQLPGQSDDPAVRAKSVLQSISAKQQQRAQLKSDPHYLAKLKGYTTK